jgi:hypothetical protein
VLRANGQAPEFAIKRSIVVRCSNHEQDYDTRAKGRRNDSETNPNQIESPNLCSASTIVIIRVS